METTNLLIVCLILTQEEKETEAGHDYNQKRRERWAAMSEVEKDERTRSIPRHSLPQPHKSHWNIAYNSNSQRALITLTGLNREAFDRLHKEFAPLFSPGRNCCLNVCSSSSNSVPPADPCVIDN